jgi:hypothetical protein
MFVSKTTGSQNLNLVRDPFFNNTVLLLHGDGINAANNSVFLDSSSFNNNITKVGTTIQGTFSPFSTTGWSNIFNGTTDYLSVPTSTEFNIGSSNFTVEGWIYPTSVASTALVVERRVSGGFVAGDWGLYIFSSNLVFFAHNYDAGGNAVLTSGAITANVWTHFALVRSGSTTSLYINGVLAASTSAVTISTNTSDITIGADIGSGTRWFFPGYISNLRFVNGTAVYTGNFSTPTSELTSITNTKLLTCQSNRFKDVTRSGSTAVQSFSPFTPSRLYSKSMFGGSVVFNGTSDSLDVSASNNFYFGSTDNFSIEGWVYPVGPLTSNQVIISTLSTNQGSYVAGQFEIYLSPTSWVWRYAANTTFLNGQGGGSVTSNAWNYFSYTKQKSGGGVVTEILNSGSTSGAPSDTIFGTSTVGPTIGYRKNSNTSMTYFKGNISDLQIRKFVGSYTPSYTPLSAPTLPKSPVANTESNGGGTTQFLLSGTNAGIIDSTQKNNLITVGAAALSSTVSKFGETSMFFNGTTDYLSVPTNASFDQNVIFTVEFWAYKTGAGTGNGYLYAQNTHSFLTILFNATNNVLIDKSSVGIQITSSSTFASNAWHHIAMVYDGTNTRLFVNGVLQGTMSGGGLASATTLTIGAYLSGSNFFQGYIDELRVTRGVARYTSNFTPRTGRFPDR